MTVHVRALVGSCGEECFAGRLAERVEVATADASKRRLRLRSEGGTDVAVDVPRGTYLHHGAVLDDDGTRIIVVDRKPEDALVVRFAPELSVKERVAAALRLGHAFGNQHVPIEVAEDELRAPITSSAELAEQTVRSLGLAGVEASIERVRLGCDQPLSGHIHGHHH